MTFFKKNNSYVEITQLPDIYENKNRKASRPFNRCAYTPNHGTRFHNTKNFYIMHNHRRNFSFQLVGAT